jgi:hypothetical protein
MRSAAGQELNRLPKFSEHDGALAEATPQLESLLLANANDQETPLWRPGAVVTDALPLKYPVAATCDLTLHVGLTALVFFDA